MNRCVPPVVAAIPTYNMAPQVSSLVPALLEHEYDRIVVLDDASKDQTAEQLSDTLGGQIEIVQGDKNIGAAGNRNRILPVLGRLGYGSDTVINFIDADLGLEHVTERIPMAAREIMAEHLDAGLVGAQILNPDGSWSAFNYGPLFSARYLASSIIQMKVDHLQRTDPTQAAEYYRKHARLLAGWPDPGTTPEVKKVGWVLEGFAFMRAAAMQRVGGYDQSLRYCETVDMGARLEAQGLDRVFDPRITVRHLETDVRGGKRNREIAAAVLRLSGRHIRTRLIA